VGSGGSGRPVRGHGFTLKVNKAGHTKGWDKLAAFFCDQLGVTVTTDQVRHVVALRTR
jgi:hypothetical protein